LTFALASGALHRYPSATTQPGRRIAELDAEEPIMAVGHPAPLPPLERPRNQWRLLFRAIGVASDPRSLILAALGVVAIRVGWSALTSALDQPHWSSVTIGYDHTGHEALGSPLENAEGLAMLLLRPASRLLLPFISFFRPDVSAGERFYFGLVAVWSLVVWSIFGGAIARIAVVRVANGGRVGVLSALKFSLTRLGTLIAAPMVPLAVAWLIAITGMAVGLLNRVFPAAATALAFIPLIVGLLDAVILLGLVVAWPLMVATVAADGEDFFDAISRSYSYVNQQTFRYAAYLGLAGLIGCLGIVAVNLFVRTALGLADWSISLGAPRLVGFRFALSSTDSSDLPWVARGWNGLVEALVSGWTSSYLWSTAAIVYLVLRRDVDGAGIYEIYQPKQLADAAIPDEPVEAGPHEVGPAKAD